jgi:YYY domain-containing protein
MTWLPEIARWYGVLLAATVAWAPWVRLLCAGLSDRGATIARPLGLLATVYPVWLLAFGPLPYSAAALWIVLALAAASGWAVAARRRLIDRNWLEALVAGELLALVAFLAALWLRGFTPDIANTEKPMDIAFLASGARAESMPPADPWFAGESINYYYLGYLLHGSVARLADVAPSVAFNLALATTFSMTVVAAAGLAYNATRRWLAPRRALVAAALAAFLLAVAGNLYAAARFVESPSWNLEAGWAGWWDSQRGIGWWSSRVICDAPRQPDGSCDPGLTIAEFPFFSFLLGDLHPHVTGLPFTIVVLTLALNLLLVGRLNRSVRLWRSPANLATVAVTGAVAGSLYAFNSWDFPTFLVVVLGAGWLASGNLPGRERVWTAAIVVGAAIVPWLPFYLTFDAPVGNGSTEWPAALRDLPVLSRLFSTIGAHTGERTSTSEFLGIWGVPWLAALGLLLSAYAARSRPADAPPTAPSARRLRPLVPGIVVAALAALLLPAPVILLAGLPLLVAVLQLLDDRTPSPRTLATALFALGFALLIATEFFYIQDLFNSRMNTIFKVYYQVWTLFAVATALTVVTLWREVRPRSFVRPAVAAFTAFAVLAGLVYPVVASYQWTDHFLAWRTLDGRAYLASTAPDELAAIEWLEANATVDDVVLEAAGCSYDVAQGVPNNRASAFSGVPTVIGWGWHERQWRNGQPEERQIGPRQEDVRLIFGELTADLLDRYGITLLYVGRLERYGTPGCNVGEPYPSVTSPSFPGTGWEQVFTEGEVAIYRRLDVAAEPPATGRRSEFGHSDAR